MATNTRLSLNTLQFKVDRQDICRCHAEARDDVKHVLVADLVRPPRPMQTLVEAVNNVKGVTVERIHSGLCRVLDGLLVVEQGVDSFLPGTFFLIPLGNAGYHPFLAASYIHKG